MEEKLKIIINSGYSDPPKEFAEVIQFFLGDSVTEQQIKDSFSYIYDSETDEVEFSFCYQPESTGTLEVPIFFEINNRGTFYEAVKLRLNLDGPQVNPTWIARVPAYGRIVREIYSGQSTVQNINPGDYNPTIGTNYYKPGNKNNYITKDSYDDFIRSREIENHPLDEVGRTQYVSSTYYKIYKTLELKCNALEGKDKDSYGNYYTNSREVRSYIVTGLYTYDLYDETQTLIRENVEESTSLITLHNENNQYIDDSIGVLWVPDPDPNKNIGESYNYNYTGLLYYEDFSGNVKSIKSRNHITVERYINAEFGGEDDTPVYFEQKYPLYILGPLKNNTITISIQLVKKEVGQESLPRLSNIKFNGTPIENIGELKFHNYKYNSILVYEYNENGEIIEDSGEFQPLFEIIEMRYDAGPTEGKLIFKVRAALDNDELDPWRPSYASILPVLEVSTISFDKNSVNFTAEYPYYIVQKSTKIGIIPQRFPSRDSKTGENLPRSKNEPEKYELKIDGTIGVKTAFIGISSEVDPYDENIVRNWAITEKMEMGNRERFYFFEKYSGDLLEKIVLYTSVNNMTLPEFYVRDYIDRSTEWRRALYESEVTIIPVVENTGSIVDLGGGWSYRLDAPTPFFLGHNLLFVFNNSNRYVVKRFNLYFSGPENQQINDGSGNNNNVFSASINGFNILGGTEGETEEDEELGLTYTHYGLRDVIYDKLYPGATPHDLYTLEDVESTYDNGNLEPMVYTDNTPVKIGVETDSFIFIPYNTTETPDASITISLDDILILGTQFYKVVPMMARTGDGTGYGLIKLDDIVSNVNISTTNLNIDGDIYQINDDKSLSLIENSSLESVRIEVEYTILVITEGNNKHFYVVEVTSESEQGKEYGLREITITATEGESIFDIDSSYYTITSKYTLGRYKSLTSIKSRAQGDKREIFFGYIGCWGNYVYFDIIYPQKIKNIPSGIFKTPSDNYFLRFIFTLSQCYAATTDPQEIQFWCGTENIDPLHLLPVNGMNTELIPPDWSEVQGYPGVPLTSDTSKFNLASKTVSSEYSDWKVNFPFENRFIYSAPNGTKIINERTLGEGSYLPDDEKDYLLVERKDDDGGSDIVDFLRVGTFPNFYYDWKFYIYNRLQSRFEFYSSAGSRDFTIGDGTEEISELTLNKIGLYRIYISTLNNLGDDIEASLSFEVRCGSNRSIIEDSLFLTKNHQFGQTQGLEDPEKLISIERKDSIKVGQGYEINTSNGSSYILYLWYEGVIGSSTTILNNLNARIVFTYTITTTGRTLSKSIPLKFTNNGNLLEVPENSNFFTLEPYRNTNDSSALGSGSSIQFERILDNGSEISLDVSLKNNINNANYVGIPIIDQFPGYIDLVNTSYPYRLAFNEEQGQGQNFDWLIKDYRCEINSPSPITGEDIRTESCYLIDSYRKSFYKFSINPEVNELGTRKHYHTNEAYKIVNIDFQDQILNKKYLKIIYYPPIDPNQFFLGYSTSLGYVKGSNRNDYYVNENYKLYVDNGYDYIHSGLSNTIRFNYDQNSNNQLITIHGDNSNNLLGATDRLVFKEIKNNNLELVSTIWEEGGTTTSLEDERIISKEIVTNNNYHVLRFVHDNNHFPELRWRKPSSAEDRSSFKLKVLCDGEKEYGDSGNEATNTPLYLFERFKEAGVSDECEQVNYFTLAKFKATYNISAPSEVGSGWESFWKAMYDDKELTTRYFGAALQYKGNIDIISGTTDEVLSNPEILPCTDDGLQYGSEHNPRFLIPLGMFGTSTSHKVQIGVTLDGGIDSLVNPRNLMSTVDILYKDGSEVRTGITPSISNGKIEISFNGTLTNDIIVQPHFTNIEYNYLKGNLSWSASTGGTGVLKREWLEQDPDSSWAKIDPTNATNNYTSTNNSDKTFWGIIIKDSQKFKLTSTSTTNLNPITVEVGDSINIIGSGFYTVTRQGSEYKLNICNPIEVDLDGEYGTILGINGSKYYVTNVNAPGGPELVSTNRSADVQVTLKTSVLLFNGEGPGYYVNTSPYDSSNHPYLFEIAQEEAGRILTIGGNGYLIEKDYSGLLNSLGRVNDTTDFAKILRSILRGSSMSLIFNIDNNSRSYELTLRRRGYNNAFLVQPGVFYKYRWKHTTGTHTETHQTGSGNNPYAPMQWETWQYYDTTSYNFYKIWYSFYEPDVAEINENGESQVITKQDELLRYCQSSDGWTWLEGKFSQGAVPNSGPEVIRMESDVDQPYREIYIAFPQRKNENILDSLVVGDRNSPILGMNYFPFREDYLVNSSIISAGDSNFIYSNYSQNKYRMEYEGDYYYTENPKYYYLLSGYIFTGEYENTINSLWKPQIDDDSLWKTEGNSWGRTPIMSDHGTLYEEPSMIGPWSGAYEGELTGYEEDDKPSENKISYKQESNGETINYYNVDFLEVL